MDNTAKLITKAGKALQQGKHADAKKLLRKILKRQPAHGDANYLLGTALAECGEFKAALVHLKQAQLALPRSPYVHNNLGNIYLKTAQTALAAHHYEAALRLQAQLPQAHFNLATIYKMEGRHEEALQHFASAADDASFAAQASIGRASALSEMGRYAEALDCLQPMLASHADNAHFITTLGEICLHGRCEAELLQQLQQGLHRLLDTPARLDAIAPIERVPLYFHLAALEERAGNYDTAFSYYTKANALKHKQGHGEDYPQREQQLQQAYATEVAVGDSEQRPLFIVGMPRSGSTLVEQILDCHTQLHGLGECEVLQGLLNDKPQPLAAQQLAPLAAAYLEATDTTARRGIDKSLGNTLNIGAILQLFPRARIIYTRRDPLDTCLSCYFTNFYGQHDYSYDLQQLGQHQRHTERLMAWWQQRYPEAIYPIDYEALVADPEPQIRKLLDFCSEPWEAACLSPHSNPRYAATASSHQVRQPFYRSSVGRAEHFTTHLQPLLEALQEE